MSTTTKTLLDSDESWLLPEQIGSCWNAKGHYDALQFVLRLRPDIQKTLDSLSEGFFSSEEITHDQVRVFSTYLHETIHWWQHIGSVNGLVLSLVYPSMVHMNQKHLKELHAEGYGIKPVCDIGLDKKLVNGLSQKTISAINSVTNNYYDMEFYRRLVMDPKTASTFVNNTFFENVGHSYRITISHILSVLSDIIDPNLNFLPDPDSWAIKAEALSQSKTRGFYYKSLILPTFSRQSPKRLVLPQMQPG